MNSISYRILNATSTVASTTLNVSTNFEMDTYIKFETLLDMINRDFVNIILGRNEE